MKIAFYNTKPYDKLWFEPLGNKYGFTIDFLESPCNPASVALAKGYDAICIFVNDTITAEMIDGFVELGVKAILLRCAGYWALKLFCSVALAIIKLIYRLPKVAFISYAYLAILPKPLPNTAWHYS